jgi:hypothetical protein
MNLFSNSGFRIAAIWLLNIPILCAQVNTVFYEDFDTPPLNVSTNHTQPGTIQYWNDTNALSVSGAKSYHANVLPQDTIFFQTQAFSTVGNSFVRLSFDHIGKIHFGQRGYIRVSTNNGATWTTLNASHYRGSSTIFGNLGYVNEAIYDNPANTNYWGGATTVGQGVAPTNNWWVNEVFDISSIAGSGPSGTGTGFSQVIVKFALQYRVPSGGATTAGWFIDNLKVEAAPCELIPPKINWNLNPRREPIGARYQATEQVRLRASDKVLPKSGIDSVVLHYQMNGGTWNMVNLTAVNTASCPDSSEYFYDFTNLVLGDTINWWVQAFDCACDENSVRSPSTAAAISFNTFWRDPSPPAVCGPSLPNSFPYVATIFPYIENFEAGYWMAGAGAGSSGTTHRGIFPLGNPPAGRNYEVSPNPQSSGFAWSVRTGQTGTFGTGPDGDHTTGQGKYLYTEASQGNQGNATILITPCLKLDNLSHAAAEFYYHKFGAHMGNLRVDIDTGAGFLNNLGVIGVNLITGSTHRGIADPWDKAFINLDPYLGKYVRIRFVGTKNNSAANDRGDMAIDDIKIFQPFTRDINLLESFKPQNGFCTYTNQEDVKIRFRTEGSQTLTQIPLAFSVKNLATGATTILRDTVVGSFVMGDTMTYTFTPKANLSAYTNFEVYIWSELNGDGQSSNDSIGPIAIEHIQPISSFPYFLNFDGPGWAPGNGTTASPGTFAPSGWLAQPSSNSGDYAFMVGRDLTPTDATGPRWSKGRKGNYLYAEGSFGANSPFAIFQQEGCVDLSGMTNPVMSFLYYMYGADIASLGIQVVPSGSNTWNTLPSSIITGQQQSSETGDWAYKLIDLSAYAGQTIKMRLVASKSGAGHAADIAIDDLLIYEHPNNDVGVTTITSPPNTVFLATPQNLVLKVRNYGKQPKTNVPVTVVVKDLCTPSSTNTYTYTVPSIAAGAEATLTVTSPVSYWEGDLEIKAYTTLAGDAFSRNDTASRITTGTTSIGIPVGPITFDNCVGNEYAFFAQGGTGTLQMWEMGQPGKGFTAASGSNVWMTGLTQNYQGVGDEYLRMPPLTNFDTIMGAELRFKHRFDFGGTDGGNIEYLNNGATWNVLGNATATIGQNWYGSSYGSSGVAALNNQPGWTGSTGGNWITSTLPLAMWNFNSNPLNLRFRMGTAVGSSGAGWAIDDIEIFVPAQNAVTLNSGTINKTIVSPGDSVQVILNITNSGQKPITNLVFEISGFGGLASEQIGLTTPIFRGQSTNIVLNSYFVIQNQGVQNICVTAVKVNNRNDPNPNDDTTCFSFISSSPINLSATGASYCNDFEASAWSTSSMNSTNSIWQRGTPDKGTLQTAHSGTKAYSTSLSGLYGNNSLEYLYSPKFIIDTNKIHKLSFYHNFQIENIGDGGAIEYSVNEIEWFPLGTYNEKESLNWYNCPAITSLDGLSGWSGTNSGYENAMIWFELRNTNQIRFRFKFTSNQVLSNLGWTVDDICIEEDNNRIGAIILPDNRLFYNSGCF